MTNRVVDAFEIAGGDLNAPHHRDLVELISTHAPSLAPLLIADPSIVPDVLARPLSRRTTLARTAKYFFDDSLRATDDNEFRRILRQKRQRALVRIAAREAARLAEIETTSAELAWLAEASIETAFRYFSRALDAETGAPLDAHTHARIPFVVLGMGKLGGTELNFGSDVDLCFFYDTDDGTLQNSDKSVHEYFTRLARAITAAIADVTEDGFVFRVDLRLRPEGTRGALVNSLASAERYYESFGRTWERAALLRARPVAGDAAFGNELLATLRPFVFPREMKPNLPREMHDMMDRTRRELRIDLERDVKLGRGGIRELEFFVQTLQLLWGGQHKELRVQNTNTAIMRLVSAGFLGDGQAQRLIADWELLRRLEHRIHMSTGYQTHSLPDDRDEVKRMAASLGFANAQGLRASLSRTRTRVAQAFSSLLTGSSPIDDIAKELAEHVANASSAQPLAEFLAKQGIFHDPDEAASHLFRLTRSAMAPLGPIIRAQHPEFGALLLRQIVDATDPNAALANVANFFSTMKRTFSYDKLLASEPRLLRRLVSLFGTSPTLSMLLIGHPEEIDRLLAFGGVPTREEISVAHNELRSLHHDVEQLVPALRRLQREMTLRIGLAHVARELDARGVESLLSALADAQVTAALDAAMSADARSDVALVACAMGKHGGNELGFGGDLDLIFIYTPNNEARDVFELGDIAARAAQQTMRILSQSDAEGAGYKTDARLRPSGANGLLVVSLAAFEQYHATKAAPWERQALVRARTIAGDEALAAELTRAAEKIAYASGAPDRLEMARLRKRMELELARETKSRAHPKLGFGALVDIEFIVQGLQMEHGQDERLRHPNTLHAIRSLLDADLLSWLDAETLRESWIFFRGVEQALRLLDLDEWLFLEIPVLERVARHLGIQNRDEIPAGNVLFETYRRAAFETRAAFERLVGPTHTAPVWDRAQVS